MDRTDALNVTKSLRSDRDCGFQLFGDEIENVLNALAPALCQVTSAVLGYRRPNVGPVFLKFCSVGDDVLDNSSKPAFTAPMESIMSGVARSIQDVDAETAVVYHVITLGLVKSFIIVISW